ncbi:MAG: HD domain-containing protein [Acidihalobacter sp.]|jgi:putative hydrolases of HD superfamily|uniref:HD domain-containing protein n=1 Tax=Acidihalobacter sp. TaxID=1872108 RepID=UPI00307F0095
MARLHGRADVQGLPNGSVDIDCVISMLLIHDVGEIDAVGTPELGPRKKRTWREFEEGDTAAVRFARAIDRVFPLLHDLHGDGHSWKENSVSSEKVFSVNNRIVRGRGVLWAMLEARLHKAVENGMFG